MKISVKKLYNEINTLNRLIDNYEENYLNYFNILSSFSISWDDKRSKFFFNNARINKYNFELVRNDLKDVRRVYSYIADKYSAIGNNIFIDLGNKNRVVEAFNSYIGKLDSIINDFNNLSLGFCPNIAYLIRKERANIVAQRNKLVDCRKEIIYYFDTIKKYEEQIRNRISSLQVSSLKKTDINGSI